MKALRMKRRCVGCNNVMTRLQLVYDGCYSVSVCLFHDLQRCRDIWPVVTDTRRHVRLQGRVKWLVDFRSRRTSSHKGCGRNKGGSGGFQTRPLPVRTRGSRMAERASGIMWSIIYTMIHVSFSITRCARIRNRNPLNWANFVGTGHWLHCPTMTFQQEPVRYRTATLPDPDLIWDLQST